MPTPMQLKKHCLPSFHIQPPISVIPLQIFIIPPFDQVYDFNSKLLCECEHCRELKPLIENPNTLKRREFDALSPLFSPEPQQSKILIPRNNINSNVYRHALEVPFRLILFLFNFIYAYQVLESRYMNWVMDPLFWFNIRMFWLEVIAGLMIVGIFLSRHQ